MLLCKDERLLKNVLPDNFFQASGNSVRKRKVYNIKVVIQNSAFKDYLEFYIRSHKDSEIILFLTRAIL